MSRSGFVVLALVAFVHSCPPGAQGPIGPRGLTGLQGLRGFNGTTGARGLQGLQGQRGPNGLAVRVGPTVWIDVVNGNDVNNTGAVSAPFKSISRALSLLPGHIPPGSAWTFRLSSGVYNEPLLTIPTNVVFRGTSLFQTQIPNGLRLVSLAAEATGNSNTWEFHDIDIANIFANTTLANGNSLISFFGCGVTGGTFVVPNAAATAEASYQVIFADSYVASNTLTGQFYSIRGSQLNGGTFAALSTTEIQASNVFGAFTVQGATVTFTDCRGDSFQSAPATWTPTGSNTVSADSVCRSILGSPVGLILKNVESAKFVAYAPFVPSNWAGIAPISVSAGLDQLAATTYTAADVSINIAGVQQAPTFQATGRFPTSGIHVGAFTSTIDGGSIATDGSGLLFAHGHGGMIGGGLTLSTTLPFAQIKQGFVYANFTTGTNVAVDTEFNVCSPAVTAGVGSAYYRLQLLNLGNGAVTLTASDGVTIFHTLGAIASHTSRFFVFYCQSGLPNQMIVFG